uniref:Uncharacterized protein n=1 Tax=viral metagenome TaxID=1070528 RepID=A0A6C0DR72_9ZZZZ
MDKIQLLKGRRCKRDMNSVHIYENNKNNFDSLVNRFPQKNTFVCEKDIGNSPVCSQNYTKPEVHLKPIATSRLLAIDGVDGILEINIEKRTKIE